MVNMEQVTGKQRERIQFAFEIDPDLDAEINEVVSLVPGLKKAVLGRSSLREKVREIKQKLANGEEVVVSI